MHFSIFIHTTSHYCSIGPPYSDVVTDTVCSNSSASLSLDAARAAEFLQQSQTYPFFSNPGKNMSMCIIYFLHFPSNHHCSDGGLIEFHNFQSKCQKFTGQDKCSKTGNTKHCVPCSLCFYFVSSPKILTLCSSPKLWIFPLPSLVLQAIIDLWAFNCVFKFAFISEAKIVLRISAWTVRVCLLVLNWPQVTSRPSFG